MKILTGLVAFFPWIACAASIEIWAGIEFETAQKVKQHIENLTEHTVEVRRFDINTIRAELVVADPRDTAFPDAIWVPSDFLGLSDYIDISTIPTAWVDESRYEEKALEVVELNGELKALPVAIGNQLVLYSRVQNDALHQNLSQNQSGTQNPSNAQMTWEQLITLSQESSREAIAFPNPNMYFYLAFHQLFSNQPFSSRSINGESVLEIFRFIEQLEQQGVIAGGCDNGCARQRFLSGQVDYLIDGDWAYNELSQSEPNLTINALPTYRGKPMASFSGAKVFAITEKGMQDIDKQLVLREMVSFLQSNRFSYLARSDAMMSPFKDVNQKRMASNEGSFTQMYQQFQAAQIMSSDYYMAIVWEASARALERYKLGMPKEEIPAFYDDFVERYAKRLGGQH
ncbi:extracellular solute-binding protein [Vibrio sp. Isolate30]|uniref:sugar ABC transporter substrate-binding protein n=1 Tax=Vibrio TaxID=662 RepID=UPI001EFDD2B7|nr:extracellular solute-binding protein [Vibrio sp. Isolate30]MCG9632438.1 extracellular solute-binding protein [Vibrio sp. Isolate30]